MNILVPSVAVIQGEFAVSYRTVQLTLTLYMFTLALGQFVYGPLSDALGRRQIMLWSIAIFTAGGMLGAVAPGLDVLIASRVIQAAGGCGMIVLSRVIVVDVHSGDRAASVLGFITMAWVLVPMFAPLLGGIVTDHFGWRPVCLLTGLLGLATFGMTWIYLTETLAAPRPFPGVVHLMTEIGGLSRNRAFASNTLHVALATLVFYAFIAGAPMIVSHISDGGSTVYGTYFVLVSIGYSAGNFLTGGLVQRFGAPALVTGGTLLSLAGCGIMVVLFRIGLVTPFSIFATMSVIAVGCGLSVPCGFSAAGGARPDMTGTALALTGCIQMAVGAAGTVIVSSLQPLWPQAMALTMTAGAAAAVFAGVAATRTRTRTRRG